MRAKHCAPGMVFVVVQIRAVSKKIDHPLSLISLHTALHISKKFCPSARSTNASANVTQNKFDLKLWGCKKTTLCNVLSTDLHMRVQHRSTMTAFCILWLARLWLVVICMPNAITMSWKPTIEQCHYSVNNDTEWTCHNCCHTPLCHRQQYAAATVALGHFAF